MVDGDPVARAALGAGLSEAGYEARAEPDGMRILDLVHEYRPDMIVLRSQLPAGPSGCELVRGLRRRTDVPILLLDSEDSAPVRVEGLEAGADDVLALPVSVLEVVVSARALLRRTGRLSSSVRQVGDLMVDEVARTATRGGKLLALTRTEFDLLRVLTRIPQRAFPKRQLFSEVWGAGDFNAHLVEAHVSTLRQKLEAHGPRMVETVRGEGYMLTPGD